jgi:hypothetical protein
VRRYGVWAGVAVGLVAAVIATSATARREGATAGQYGFRGAALGIALNEFRALPYPDARPSIPAQVVCSGDAAITPENESGVFRALRLGAVEKAKGLIRCGYFQHSSHPIPRTNRTFTVWLTASVLAANYPGEFTYRFAPRSPGGELRLYEISADDIRMEGASELVEGLTKRYGAPTIDRSDTMQVRSGAVFPRRSLQWRSGQQTITLIAPGEARDFLSLTFRQVDHAEAVERDLREALGSPASRL